MERSDGLLARGLRLGLVIALLGLSVMTRPGGPPVLRPPESFWLDARLRIDQWFDESVDPWRQEWHDSAAGIDVVVARVGSLVRSATGMSRNTLRVDERAGGDDAVAKRDG